MGIAYNTSVVRDGLVLHLDAANVKSYPGSGTTWKDLSGNGNDGTLTNGPTYSSDNKGNFGFDGSNEYTVIPNNTSINFTTNSFSLSCWTKTSQTGTTRMIMSKGNSDGIVSGTAYNLYLGNAGTTWLFGVWDGTGNGSTGSSQYVEVGKWVNLCGVYDAELSSHKMYANGNLIGSSTRDVDDISVTNDLFVGSGANGGLDWLGNIGICQIYNRALSADEIKQNFEATRGRYGI